MLFIFLKQKTAYEMRISDWSSDVCSSDFSILNARDDSILGERGLQLRRKPFLRSELIARVKTVTEGDHERCVGGNRGRRFRRNLVVRRRRWRLRRSTCGERLAKYNRGTIYQDRAPSGRSHFKGSSPCPTPNDNRRVRRSPPIM